jgi:hypothetical protein
MALELLVSAKTSASQRFEINSQGGWHVGPPLLQRSTIEAGDIEVGSMARRLVFVASNGFAGGGLAGTPASAVTSRDPKEVR